MKKKFSSRGQPQSTAVPPPSHINRTHPSNHSPTPSNCDQLLHSQDRTDNCGAGEHPYGGGSGPLPHLRAGSPRHLPVHQEDQSGNSLHHSPDQSEAFQSPRLKQSKSAHPIRSLCRVDWQNSCIFIKESFYLILHNFYQPLCVKNTLLQLWFCRSHFEASFFQNVCEKIV